MDIKDLHELFLLCQTYNVQKYKSGALEIVFSSKNAAENPTEIQGLPATTVDADESALPPDLRTDKITKMDSILNWSAPSVEDEPMPLTGEAPLEA